MFYYKGEKVWKCIFFLNALLALPDLEITRMKSILFQNAHELDLTILMSDNLD